jgi:hypothetical protein
VFFKRLLHASSVLPEYINSDFLHNFGTSGSESGDCTAASTRFRPVQVGRKWSLKMYWALPASAQTSFYRTSVGAEIDLIIEFGAKDRWAIEVKRSLGNPAPTKGFYI